MGWVEGGGDMRSLFTWWCRTRFSGEEDQSSHAQRKSSVHWPSNLKMKDVNMCQKLHIPHHNEMHIAQKHPPMLLSVNEESIELLRDYHFEAWTLLFQELSWNLLVISRFLNHSLHFLYPQWILLMSPSQNAERSLRIHTHTVSFLICCSSIYDGVKCLKKL